MGKHEKIETDVEQRNKNLTRIFGSAPWMKPSEKKDYIAKVFKSGNSLALRLPAELNLKAGMEMNLRVEDGEFYSFEPVERPKRKFNVAKVWGSAINLNEIDPDDRWFEEREPESPRNEPSA